MQDKHTMAAIDRLPIDFRENVLVWRGNRYDDLLYRATAVIEAMTRGDRDRLQEHLRKAERLARLNADPDIRRAAHRLLVATRGAIACSD